MNQIIDFKGYKKTNENINNSSTFNNRKYKILFIIFSATALLFLIILFIKIYMDNKNEEIAKKLTNSYSISTLYSTNTTYTPEAQSSEPFVIGIIKIDKINLNYSILSVSNNDLLDISVCRFAGPMPNEVGNLCIAGHNYVDYKYFSRLNELEINDIITIYDLNGNSIDYSIYNVNGKRLVVHARAL